MPVPTATLKRTNLRTCCFWSADQLQLPAAAVTVVEGIARTGVGNFSVLDDFGESLGKETDTHVCGNTVSGLSVCPLNSLVRVRCFPPFVIGNSRSYWSAQG